MSAFVIVLMIKTLVATYQRDRNNLKGVIEMPNFNNHIIEERKLRRNGEGYPDPTAYKAIKNINSKSEKVYKLIGCILRICELSGFSVEERIVLRDNETGKVWR